MAEKRREERAAFRNKKAKIYLMEPEIKKILRRVTNEYLNIGLKLKNDPDYDKNLNIYFNDGLEYFLDKENMELLFQNPLNEKEAKKAEELKKINGWFQVLLDRETIVKIQIWSEEEEGIEIDNKMILDTSFTDVKKRERVKRKLQVLKEIKTEEKDKEELYFLEGKELENTFGTLSNRREIDLLISKVIRNYSRRYLIALNAMQAKITRINTEASEKIKEIHKRYET